MDVYVKEGEEFIPISEDFTVLDKSELSSKFVSREDHQAGITSAVQSRFKNHVHLDEAHTNETVVARVLETHGGKVESVDLDKQREQWATANLKPIQSELEDTRTSLERLTSKLKYQDMREHFGKVFDDSLTDRIAPDKPSLAEVLFGDQIDFDTDTSSIKLKGSAMSVDDFIKELSVDEKYKRYLREPDKNTSAHGKLGQDGNVSANGQKPKSKSELDDHANYIRTYGLNRPKVEGFPAYNQLK